LIAGIAIPAIVIISALLFGSVEDWAIAGTGLMSLCSFNAWLFTRIKRGDNFVFLDRPILFSVLACISFFLLQLIPLPELILKILSPERYSLDRILNLSGFHSISVYPYASLHALARFLIYFSIFIMAASLASERIALMRAIQVIVIFGFLVSLFALIQMATWNGKIYWFRELSRGGSPFGPFVNKNHFAGFVGMIVPFGLALALRMKESAKRFLFIFSSVVMSLGLFYSLSRGGIISFIVSMGMFSLLVMIRRTKSKPVIVSAVFVVLLLSYLIYFGLSPVIERFASTDVTLSQRVTVWKSFLNAAADFWLAGGGIGTFPYISPLYHPEGITSFFDHAHNDYLEFFVEMGSLGSIIAIIALMIFFRNILKTKWWQSKDVYLVLAGFSSFLSIAVHSLADFNLHIPSNAILLSTVLGILYGTTRETEGEKRANVQ
jgi:O-antigen ligase